MVLIEIVLGIYLKRSSIWLSADVKPMSKDYIALHECSLYVYTVILMAQSWK
jgi:hypothetical protein